MNDQASSLLKLIESQSARVGIVGLGYVGLPLIRAFIDAGFPCLGLDVDSEKVSSLREGQSYIRHIPSEWIQQWLAQNMFDATADMSRLREPDVILICVPTPLDEQREPDLRFVTATADKIAAQLRPGQLVVLESTTYPGTTRDVVLPILNKSGLACGDSFFLAYSPEREDPGNPDHTARTIPKVVGGIEPASAQLADALYRQAVVTTVPVGSCEVAEACKILENTYRSVNIAMVNELKMLFDRMGIDVWEVVEAAKTKPFGFQAFYPGPGLGGHCIPIDPFYLSWIARQHGMQTEFIELAGRVNSSMPAYVIRRLKESLSERETIDSGSEPADEREDTSVLRDRRIGLLGVAYKPNVDDPRESPAFRLMELLAREGARFSYNDPYIGQLPSMRSFDVPALESQELTADYLAEQDAILIVTDHRDYDWSFIVRHARLIIDTRNATRHIRENRERIIKA